MDCQDICPLLERKLLWGDSGGPPSPSSNLEAMRKMTKWEKEEDLKYTYLEGDSQREEGREKPSQKIRFRKRQKEEECGGKRNRTE